MDERMTTGELHISIDAFAEPDRADAFRENVGRAILRFEMEPLPGHPMQSELVLRGLPGVGMASGYGSAMINRHTPDLIDNDDVVISFIHAGGGVHEQFGQRAEVVAGEAVLTANGEPATFTLMETTKLLNIRLERARVADYLADIDAAIHGPKLAASGALRLLRAYAGALESGGHLSSHGLQQTAATHLFDLASLALGAKGELAGLARTRGVRAARLLALKDDIRANLTDNGLSLEKLARRHAISARYVRQLFADEHTSFTDFLLGQRLALAHRLLTSPRLARRPIGAIAFDCGFGDLSYFNHAFRRLYGATPGDIRKAALDQA